MKEILLLIAAFMLLEVGNGQKPKDQKNSEADSVEKVVFDPVTDSLPSIADAVEFISTRDLIEFWRRVKLIMTSDEFKKADPITQYQMITVNAGSVFENSEWRWRLKNKIKKPVK